MKISPVQSRNTFSAKTKISAPEEYISKKEVKNYVKMGGKIGIPFDSIDIFVSNVYKTPFSPHNEVFDVNYKTRIGDELRLCFGTYSVDKITPKQCLDDIFSSISKK